MRSKHKFFLGDEFFQDGKWVPKKNFFLPLLEFFFSFLFYFALSDHYLFSGEESQKKVIKEEDWFIFVFLGKMILIGNNLARTGILG